MSTLEKAKYLYKVFAQRMGYTTPIGQHMPDSYEQLTFHEQAAWHAVAEMS